MRLFEFADGIRNCVTETDVDPETGEISAEAIERMTSLDMGFDAKAEAVAGFLLEIEAEGKAIKAAEGELNKKRKSRENQVERLKSYLYDCLKAAGKTKAGGDVFHVAIQANASQALVIENEGIIPSIFRIVPEPVIDTESLKKSLLAGNAVPGARLVRGEHLRIR